MRDLPEFRLEAFFAQHEFTAKHFLAASDAQTMTLAGLLALAGEDDRRAFETLPLGYVETHGTPALRAAIAATYESISPDDVLTFAGAEEGLYIALHALLAPGDHAVVTVPNYQSMESVARSIADVTGLALRPDGARWSIDLDELRRALRPNTRVVAVNFPNNPTGFVPDAGTWSALVALCAERGIHLFADEVYRGIELDRAPVTQAADAYDRGVSLHVMSKAYGLPGLRVGWIATRDRALRARMSHFKHYLSICCAAPSEHLATIALKARDAIQSRLVDTCRTNLAAFRAFFVRHADRYAWSDADGGCVAFPRYLGRDADAHCAALLDRAGVLLLPPAVFRTDLAPTPADRFRIGFGRAPAAIAAGLAAWEEALGALRD